MAQPQTSSTRRNSGTGRLTLNPGIASSLSSVPPVWPRPRPLIIGTAIPAAATKGASTRDVLSPTPPVECLSTFFCGNDERSSTSPERNIASVSAAVSGRRHALQHNGHQPGGHLIVRECRLLCRQFTKASISARDSSTPSRFLRITSIARNACSTGARGLTGGEILQEEVR